MNGRTTMATSLFGRMSADDTNHLAAADRAATNHDHRTARRHLFLAFIKVKMEPISYFYGLWSIAQERNRPFQMLFYALAMVASKPRDEAARGILAGSMGYLLARFGAIESAWGFLTRADPRLEPSGSFDKDRAVFLRLQARIEVQLSIPPSQRVAVAALVYTYRTATQRSVEHFINAELKRLERFVYQQIVLSKRQRAITSAELEVVRGLCDAGYGNLEFRDRMATLHRNINRNLDPTLTASM